MVNSRIILLLFLLLALPSLSLAKVSAHLDRSTIEEGETFQLMLQSDGVEPELEILNQLFDVVGTSRSSKVSVINGAVDRIFEWVVTLSPKNLGTQSVPSIKFGSEATLPIPISVIKPIASAAQQGADVFLEAKVDQPSAYVQSQIIYSVRLYRAVEIRDASLTEPVFDNAIVERAGEDVTFQTQRNQRVYHVTERRYAVFPQKSGTLQFPEMVFQGMVMEAAANQFSNDPFNRFFQTQTGKRVRIKSESLTVDVKPQPANYSGEQWLPAKNLLLTESWSPENPSFKVGEPVTRTLRIEAQGLSGSQLPELKLFSAHGIKHYADQPVVETRLKGNDLLAIREEKIAVIPTASGKLILPEVRLIWWDTEYNTEKVMSIPPRIIDVAAATQSDSEAAQQVEPVAPAEPASRPITTSAVTVIDPGFWPYITAAFAFAWLVTLVVTFIVWRKNSNNPVRSVRANMANNSMSINQAMSNLKQACKENRPDEAKQAILQWAAATWTENAPRNLTQIAELIQDSTVQQAFNELSQLLYRNDKAKWNGMSFWDSVSRRMKKSRTDVSEKSKSLPELYPQRI